MVKRVQFNFKLLLGDFHSIIIHFNFNSNWVINIWNSLSHDVVYFTTLKKV